MAAWTILQGTLLCLADKSKVDKEEGVVWLHGTIRMGIARAENVPLHRRLHCNDPCTQALDGCMGIFGNRRHAHCYATLEMGPARRSVQLDESGAQSSKVFQSTNHL